MNELRRLLTAARLGSIELDALVTSLPDDAVSAPARARLLRWARAACSDLTVLLADLRESVARKNEAA
jgi:hypothetical protein